MLPRLVLLFLLVVAAPARAATVSVGPNPFVGGVPPAERDGLRFIAVPGERNDVTVTYPADPEPSLLPRTIVVRDAGAPLMIAAPECSQQDANTVVCVRAAGFGVTSVRTGDRADKVRIEGGDQFPLVGLDADGGLGTDRVIGGPGLDRLSGGGGRGDVVRSGGGADELSDGDGDVTADADVIDGGGEGILRYAGRRRPVVARLNGRPAGEGDRLTGIAELHGGTGDDRLFLGDSPAENVNLYGDAGDDELRLSPGYTREGFALLDGEAGHDTLVGAGGREQMTPGPGRDRVDCAGGPGDAVVGPGARDVLTGCDEGELRTRAGSVDFDPVPDGTRYRVGCLVRDPGDDEIEPFELTCVGTLTLSQRGRVVGRGRLRPSESLGVRPITLRSREDAGRPVRVTVRYRGGTTVRWTYRR